MQSRRKKDALLKLSPYVERRHYACRIRLDIWDALKVKCAQLNCSQGVFLEVALSKVLLADLVTEKDVFSYSPTLRWFEKARFVLESGGDFFGKDITDLQRSQLIEIFSKVISGVIDIKHPAFNSFVFAGEIQGSVYHGGVIERLYIELFGERSGFMSHKAV